MIRIARLLLSCDPWDCQHTTEDTDAAKSGSSTLYISVTVSCGRGEQSGVRGRQHGAGETPSQSLVTGNGQSGHIGRSKGRKCLGFSLSTHFYLISRLFIIFAKSQTSENSPLSIYSIGTYLQHKQKKMCRKRCKLIMNRSI